jgi:hypothetical protein
MKTASLTLPEVALLAGTRVALGAGAGLLLAECLDRQQRKTLGTALLAIGVVSTIPLARMVLGRLSEKAG